MVLSTTSGWGFVSASSRTWGSDAVHESLQMYHSLLKCRPCVAFVLFNGAHFVLFSVCRCCCCGDRGDRAFLCTLL